MFAKLRKLLSSLEDENNPSLGPTIRCLKIWGLLKPQRGFKSTIYNLLHLAGILFVASQFIQLWNIRSDLAKALKNLSVSMLGTICVVKACTFVYWQKYWKQVIEFASDVEIRQLSNNDGVTTYIIGKYTKYSRNITRLYWFIGASTVLIFIITPYAVFIASLKRGEIIVNGSQPYPEIVNTWVPFNRTRGIGYLVSILGQSLLSVYAAGIVAAYDGISVALMSFFAGQMELLYTDCGRLFENISGDITNDLSQRIKECHYHHLMLIKYSKIFDSLLSPVMFLYVVICSLMICASAFQLTTEEVTNMQRVWIIDYLVASIAQLFLYCWHSNEVLAMSNKLEGGVYKSDWWTQDVKIRRSILLLGGQLRQPVVFTAGPFTTLSVSTFISILKGAYSFYTLLAQK